MRTKITNDCLFTNTKITKKSIENCYYCIFGQEDYIDTDNNPRLKKEDEKTLAKKIVAGDGYKLYIKIDENKKIINPFSIYDEQYKHIENLKKFKTPSYKLVGVKAFDYYLRFLKTKNLSWLHNAERESE
jgi:hypothetical protein